MSGIISCGAYIPFYRLERKTVGQATGVAALPGERAVAGYDEDSVTMATEAAFDCLNGASVEGMHAIYFATTTPPYLEKHSSPIIAAALNASSQIRSADFGGGLRAASSALIAAFETAQAGRGSVLVSCADCRPTAAQGQWEQICGDGAAALLIGEEDLIATVEGHASTTVEIHAQWRPAEGGPVLSWEDRFHVSQGYNRYVKETVDQLMRRNGLSRADIAKVVLSGATPRHQVSLATSMGFEPAQIQDSLFETVGLAGAANVPMMLVDALQKAKADQYLLVVTFAEGCDALLLKTTHRIERFAPRRRMDSYLNSKDNRLGYYTYLKWRHQIEPELPKRPKPEMPSVSAVFRERKKKYSLLGSVCRSCGTPHFPLQRVCMHCHAKDNMEEYRFAGRPAVVSNYAIDRLAWSQEPPVVIAVVDFEGGGRMLCEISDCDKSEVRIGMEVEMTFRRIHETDGIVNYFWKARPIR